MLSQQRKLGLALSVGTVISSSVVGGVLLGYLLDHWLMTGPWLTVAGVILGTAGAFVSVYRIIKRLE
jgi:ATP synthase protein I